MTTDPAKVTAGEGTWQQVPGAPPDALLEHAGHAGALELLVTKSARHRDDIAHAAVRDPAAGRLDSRHLRLHHRAIPRHPMFHCQVHRLAPDIAPQRSAASAITDARGMCVACSAQSHSCCTSSLAACCHDEALMRLPDGLSD